jgi:hypothetical protein
MRWLHPYNIIGCLLLIVLAASIWFFDIGQTDAAEFLLKVFSALGVLFAVLIALYAEAIKSLVDKIHLHIELAERDNNFHDLHSTPAGAVRVFCYHLQVVNKTPYRPVINCRVWLIKILDEVGDKFEEQFVFAAPRLMQWSPAEFSPEVRSFSEDQVFDFGKSFLDQDKFDVDYYKNQGGLFKGSCVAGQRRRYVFRITADNYIRARLCTVEVNVQNTQVTKEWPYKIQTKIKIVK